MKIKPNPINFITSVITAGIMLLFATGSAIASTTMESNKGNSSSVYLLDGTSTPTHTLLPTATFTRTPTATPLNSFVCNNAIPGAACQNFGTYMRYDIDLTMDNNRVDTNWQPIEITASMIGQNVYIFYDLTYMFTNPSRPYTGWARNTWFLTRYGTQPHPINSTTPSTSGVYQFSGTVTQNFYGAPSVFKLYASGQWSEDTAIQGYIIFSSIPALPTATPTPTSTLTATPVPGSYFNPLTDIYSRSIAYSGGNKSSNGGNIEADGDVSTSGCASPTCGDPVNPRTGVFSFSQSDLSFDTGAGDLIFQRSYSSGAAENNDGLGYGWTQNHAARLIFPSDPHGMDDYVLFQSVLGNHYLFEIQPGDIYEPGPGVLAELTKSGSEYTLTTTDHEVFSFDLDGLLTSREDTQGNEFSYTYDSEDRLTEVSADGGSRYLEIGYDLQDRITSVENHAGQDVAYAYDSAGDLISFTDVLDQTWTYSYNSAHQITEVSDPDDTVITVNQYDLQGRITDQYDGAENLIISIDYLSDGSSEVTDALGNVTLYEYDLRGVSTDTTDPLGNTETKVSNANFRPTSIQNAAGHTLAMTWSANGVNLLAKTDPAGNLTQNTYDSLNNLTSTTDARGNTTTYSYNGKLLASSTDSLNGTTTYTYTPQGYLASVTDPAGRTTTYTYTTSGQRASMTDPSNNTWSYAYDALGRLTDTTDPRGRISHTEYNAAGQITRSVQNYSPAHVQNAQDVYNIVTQYQYNVRGQQVAVTDTFGRITQYVYDDADHLIQTIDALGNTTTNTYDAAGHLLSTKDALNHTTTYTYDANGRLINTVNAIGASSSGTTTFNVSANTSTVTNAMGSTTFHYDELGRVVRVVDALGNSTYTTYDANGNVATRKDALGQVTHYEYDKLNRLIKTTDPNGGITQTVYAANGERTATIDALGNQTTYTYDAFGRLVKTTDPLARETQTTYDQYGRRAASIDAAGNSITYTYDLLDRVIATTDPMGHVTHTTYNALGNVITSTDANGNVSTSTYDALNRSETRTDANGHTTTNGYDAVGNLTTTTNALNETTTYIYDALNRRTAVADPLGNTTHTYYNTLGQVFSTVDENGVATHFEYDALGRQIAVVLNYKSAAQADSETNVRYEYVYNAAGNRTQVKDAQGNITTYTYDVLNRVIGKTDPLNHSWSYQYDAAGRLTSTTDAKGQTIGYTYDVAGQLTNINYPGSEPDVSYTYNLNGQRLTMTDGLGTTQWVYDDLNRVISVTDPHGETIEYGYDAVGNRTTLTYPNNQVVQYTYDAVNQLTAVNGMSRTVNYTYNAADRLSSVERDNDVDTAYTYDTAGRVLSIVNALNGTQMLSSFEYAYDPAGNRVQAIENVINPIVPPTPTDTPSITPTATEAPTDTPTVTATLSFTDTPTATDIPTDTPTVTATATLTATQTPTPTDTPLAFLPEKNLFPASLKLAAPSQFDLDASASHFRQTGALTINYDYDPLNRLQNADYSDGRDFAYTYDANGNTLQFQRDLGTGTVTTTYAYDTANQLTTATENSNTWQYTYDANGSLTSNGASTYTYDSVNRLISFNNQSIVTTMTYNGLGQRLSMEAAGVTTEYVMDGNNPLTATSNSNVTTYLYGLSPIAEKTTDWSYALLDGSNTPRQLTNENGEITLSTRYTPWGDTLETNGSGNFTYGYFGGLMDEATGLIYVGNGQYYDPATGRFLTRDAKPNNPNPYVPLDPTGLLIAPLGMMAVLYNSRKKGSKWSVLLIILMFAVIGGAALSACGPGGTPSPTPTNPPTQPPTPTQTPTPTPSPTPTQTPPSPTSVPTPITCANQNWSPNSKDGRDEGNLEIIAKRLYFEGTSSFTSPEVRKQVFMAAAWALRTLRWNWYGTSYMYTTETAFTVSSTKDHMAWYDDNNYKELARCILNALPCSSGPNPWGGDKIVQWISPQNLNRRDGNGTEIWVHSSILGDCNTPNGCQLPDIRSRDWLLGLNPSGYAERFWDLGNVGTGFSNEYYWGGVYFFSTVSLTENSPFEQARKGIYWPPPTSQVNCPRPSGREYADTLPQMPLLPSPDLTR